MSWVYLVKMNQKNLKSNNMNATNELKRLPENKAQIDSFKNAVIGEILSGDVNPLEVHIRLKILEDTIKAIKTDIRVKNAVMDEAYKYDKQTYLGANIAVTIRKTADYSNDPIHTKLKADLKARETFLKQNKGVDPETGEVVMNYKESEVLNVKL